MANLADEIKSIINSFVADKATLPRFSERLTEGSLTRDENPISHFCVYFLPYNARIKRLFIVHHKKSGLWLSPGGHINRDEGLMAALNREIFEELGVKNIIRKQISPFLLTITPISNPRHPCGEHLDIWYRIPTDGNEFNIDSTEFHTTRWATIDEARKLITDKPNLEAIAKMEQLFN